MVTATTGSERKVGRPRRQEETSGGPLWTLAGDAAALEVVVELRPEDLPHTLLDLHRVVTQAVLRGACRLVVDVSQVDCLNSTTITALLWARRRCVARGGAVVLRNPSARSMDLIIKTGLWDVLEIEAGAPRSAGRRSS
jgi:anti-anti-sigma factor